ncbi:MAG: pectin acetylesterase-family hydrolase [Myxococcota bacterium]
MPGCFLVPLIQGLFDVASPALLPEEGGSYAYNGSMPAGVGLTRVAVRAGLADGACLDGSDPVFYARGAPVGSAHPDDWLVFLQGGGSTASLDGALEVWDVAYGEMSSRWAPPSIGARGAFDPDSPDNPFADWNVVFVHKCSYDRFLGRNPRFVDVTEVDHTVDGRVIPAGTVAQLAFRGNDIVDAVLDTLATEAVLDLPPLTDAHRVVLAGHSGGSRGATMLADAFADRVRSHAAGAEVRLVMDGGFEPSAELVTAGAIYPGGYPAFDPDTGDDLGAWRARTEASLFDVWRADGDATCLASADPDGCAEVLHVLMNWVETPFFVRQDLLDANHLNDEDDCWLAPWTDHAACRGDAEDVVAWTLDQIDALGWTTRRAATVRYGGATLVPPSGFFPACGDHEGIHTDVGLFATATTDAGVTGTYADALAAWLDDPHHPIRPVEATIGDYPVAGCPAVPVGAVTRR